MKAPAKRTAGRPQKWPGEAMTTLTIRIPVRLRAKVDRISGGATAEWVCRRIERAHEPPEDA